MPIRGVVNQKHSTRTLKAFELKERQDGLSTFLLERLLYDLEKVFVICLTDQQFGKIKTELLFIPAEETPNIGRKQFDCPFQMTSKRNFPESSMGR